MSTPPNLPDQTILINTVVVTSTTVDIDESNNTATATTNVIAQGDLTITKSATSTVTDGTSMDYTVIVTNTGPSE